MAHPDQSQHLRQIRHDGEFDYASAPTRWCPIVRVGPRIRPDFLVEFQVRFRISAYHAKT
ncbi:MAG: hypothetical protein JWR21_2146 [Herminiimonas sp.]|nr:hypothetical protein [Herminiimonas sp.]